MAARHGHRPNDRYDGYLVIFASRPALIDLAAPSPSTLPTTNDMNASVPMAKPTTVHNAVVSTPTTIVRLVVHVSDRSSAVWSSGTLGHRQDADGIWPRSVKATRTASM